MYYTVFNEPTFALAAHFPELDPIALLQLVEAPVVRLAFYEFRSRFWDGCKRVGPARAHIQLIEKALDDFSKRPEGPGRLSAIGGGDCSSPDDYHIHDSFYAFISRVYAWATQDCLDIPIRRHLEDRSICASLLWGILGICISLHENGEFPEPLFPLPTDEFEFKQVEGDITIHDIENWKINTRAMCYTPIYFPLWQEWRIRHETLKQSKDRDSFVSCWAAKVAEDYTNGPDNAIEEAHEWLQIIKVARFYKDMQHKTKVQTRHCMFEIQIAPIVTEGPTPSVHEVE
ncbi:hypothetical protein F4782DRAFT_534712 [Xylaria castorea]|nr:hypothetical protein F4782DRAFT_534712 [Xylaria castorea]